MIRNFRRFLQIPQNRCSPPGVLLTVCGVILWGGLLAVGWLLTAHFDHTPGPKGSSPSRWPESSQLTRHAGRMTLLLFAHPRCPCTLASLSQLQLVLSRTQVPIDCHVVFMAPPHLNAQWVSSPNVVKAEAISKASVVLDRSAVETRRFSAATSGQVLLYDAAGRLSFSGGITPSRGHAAECAGTHALIQLLNHRPTRTGFASTFGCPLFKNPSPCPNN